MLSSDYRSRNMPVVRPEWLALRQEAALDPALPIVDAHHHLWNIPQSPYFLRDLKADATAGHNIRASIYIEAHMGWREAGPAVLRPIGETEFVLSEIARYGDAGGLCAGIVGSADLALGAAVRPVLEAHLTAGQGRFRGLRVRAAHHDHPELQGPAGSPAAGYLAQPAVRHAVQIMGRMGLVLDVWVYQTQLAEVGDLAAACPGTRMVLNHVGGVLGIGPFAERRREGFEAWRAALRPLAAYPNLFVKLGGLGMPRVGFAFAEHVEPPGSEELARAWKPYIETCLEIFGPRRCMFESNFPVDKGQCSYGVIWNCFKRLVKGATPDEQAALFHDTACDVYNLEVSGTL